MRLSYARPCQGPLGAAFAAALLTSCASSPTTSPHPVQPGTYYLIGDLPADAQFRIAQRGRRVVEAMAPGVETVVLGSYRRGEDLDKDLADLRLAQKLGCELITYPAWLERR